MNNTRPTGLNILKSLDPTKPEETFFSRMHQTFYRTDHVSPPNDKF